MNVDDRLELFFINIIESCPFHGIIRPSCKAALHINEFFKNNFEKENSYFFQGFVNMNSLPNMFHYQIWDNLGNSIYIVLYNMMKGIEIYCKQSFRY